MPLAAMAAVVATASRQRQKQPYSSLRVQQRLIANCRKYPYLSFQEKEEFGDDASSPSVDSVAEANGPAESDSSIDNLSHDSPEEK